MAIDNSNQETTFNEAILKMQRIHLTQQTINEVRINLLAYNYQYNKYNYEVVISSLISLCYEVSPLMKDKEIEEFHLLRDLIEDSILKKRIFEINNESSFNKIDKSKKVNQENWTTLKNIMYKFEDFARKQVDIHGLSAPKKKDSSSASIDL